MSPRKRSAATPEKPRSRGGRKPDTKVIDGKVVDTPKPIIETLKEVATVIEEVKAVVVKATPSFDHKGDVSISESKTGKYLIQGGNRFSFGEVNRQTGKFLPEPKFIPAGTVEGGELMETMRKLIATMESLEKTLGSARVDLVNNMSKVMGK